MGIRFCDSIAAMRRWSYRFLSHNLLSDLPQILFWLDTDLFEFPRGLMLLDLVCLWNLGEDRESEKSSTILSSNIMRGANAFLSLVQAILLRLPGTEDGTLLPSNRRTFRSWNLPGDDANCLGKTLIPSVESEPVLSRNAGWFSSAVSLPGVTLKRGIRKGLTGESIGAYRMGKLIELQWLVKRACMSFMNSFQYCEGWFFFLSSVSCITWQRHTMPTRFWPPSNRSTSFEHLMINWMFFMHHLSCTMTNAFAWLGDQDPLKN